MDLSMVLHAAFPSRKGPEQCGVGDMGEGEEDAEGAVYELGQTGSESAISHSTGTTYVFRDVDVGEGQAVHGGESFHRRYIVYIMYE